jgi:hypothetical protein
MSVSKDRATGCREVPDRVNALLLDFLTLK